MCHRQTNDYIMKKLFTISLYTSSSNRKQQQQQQQEKEQQ
jgi:hypothetical protein